MNPFDPATIEAYIAGKLDSDALSVFEMQLAEDEKLQVAVAAMQQKLAGEEDMSIKASVDFQIASEQPRLRFADFRYDDEGFPILSADKEEQIQFKKAFKKVVNHDAEADIKSRLKALEEELQASEEVAAASPAMLQEPAPALYSAEKAAAISDRSTSVKVKIIISIAASLTLLLTLGYLFLWRESPAEYVASQKEEEVEEFVEDDVIEEGRQEIEEIPAQNKVYLAAKLEKFSSSTLGFGQVSSKNIVLEFQDSPREGKGLSYYWRGDTLSLVGLSLTSAVRIIEVDYPSYSRQSIDDEGNLVSEQVSALQGIYLVVDQAYYKITKDDVIHIMRRLPEKDGRALREIIY